MKNTIISYPYIGKTAWWGRVSRCNRSRTRSAGFNRFGSRAGRRWFRIVTSFKDTLPAWSLWHSNVLDGWKIQLINWLSMWSTWLSLWSNHCCWFGGSKRRSSGQVSCFNSGKGSLWYSAGRRISHRYRKSVGNVNGADEKLNIKLSKDCKLFFFNWFKNYVAY